MDLFFVFQNKFDDFGLIFSDTSDIKIMIFIPKIFELVDYFSNKRESRTFLNNQDPSKLRFPQKNWFFTFVLHSHLFWKFIELSWESKSCFGWQQFLKPKIPPTLLLEKFELVFWVFLYCLVCLLKPFFDSVCVLLHSIPLKRSSKTAFLRKSVLIGVSPYSSKFQSSLIQGSKTSNKDS